MCVPFHIKIPRVGQDSRDQKVKNLLRTLTITMLTANLRTTAGDERGVGRLEHKRLYDIGYGDGLAGRFRDRNYSGSLDYAMGHIQGNRANPDSAFNVPRTQEPVLVYGWGDELLNVEFEHGC